MCHANIRCTLWFLTVKLPSLQQHSLPFWTGFIVSSLSSPHRGAVVKARDKYRHPECFVCADCNLNLKQKGYFFVEGELYCETHARARTRPPEGYDTVTLYPKA